MKIKVSWKLTLIFLAMHYISGAQSLSPVVISSMGGYYSNSSASLSFTVAESSMVKTISSANNMLTQGFQQPYAILVSVPEIAEPEGKLLVYPNPTNAEVNIRCNDNRSGLRSVRIFSLTGQLILHWENNTCTPQAEWKGSISGHTAGLYIIEIVISGNSDEITEYLKLNLQY